MVKVGHELLIINQRERSLFHFLPPKKPEETYPDDGPPPLASMMNVTNHPNVKKKAPIIIRPHCTHMKESRYHNGQYRTSHGYFHSDIEKDEESQ